MLVSARTAVARSGCRITLAVLTAFCLVLAVSSVASAAAPVTPRPASIGAPATRSITPAVSNATVCAEVANKAGFSYNRTVSGYPQIVVAVAVALAESSCNPSATGYNSGGSVDRGLWQINSYYHSEVSDACAYQIQCNANAAWNISNHGTNWQPWSTYNSGAWRSHLSTAESVVTGFSFLLKDQGDGTCLGADSAKTSNGAPIFQWACDSSNNYERWQVVGTLGRIPVLKNLGTGTCLGADSGHGSGWPVFQWACNTGNSYEQWWVGGSGRYNTNGNADATLHNHANGLCLAGDGSKSGNGAPIFQWNCLSGNVYEMWN